ncbi:hypothetical protein LTR78_009379 [Recurvomyces mirabilis]|uniref:Xylanolytic transcriptional activator regulatory domain-containing protein n=1 Tax=Recurvomyces mirabilis TaxID=574656 RepID=A0AAE0WHE1_9PEZI|nr:hypothetical protein LTR78_009379 [Recurvomyces mirabilis]KAK5154331.1 hypothetical protein LTS14_007016 [Recurvomyces mirabilis]
MRRPRGRQGGRTSKETQLLARIEKLETLLKPDHAQELATAPAFVNGDLGYALNDRSMSEATTTSNCADAISTSTTREHPTATSRSQVLLGSSLFSQLSEELVGIRDILEASPESDDARNTLINGAENGSPGEGISNTTIHLFAAAAGGHKKMLVPSASDTNYLLGIFEQRVHPVVHAVHLPTFVAGIRSSLLDLGAWSYDRHAAAAQVAAFYVSIVALTDTECMQRWGVPQVKLQMQWRQDVEQQIAGSNFLVSERLETLQALIYYLVGTRSFDRSRAVWTLLPVAIRIAQALNLHREEHYRHLRPLEAQLRRCIWHCLVLIDFESAMDRGSDVVVSERGTSTRPPINANDSCFHDSLDISPAPQYGYTGLSIFLIESECAVLARVLNFVEPADMERAPTAMQYDCHARNEAVTRQENILKGYLGAPGRGLEDSTAQRLARTIISCMRLYVVRPLQRHPAMKAPRIAEIDIVGLAVETLGFTLELYRSSHPWMWYIRQFNNWHPLAVLLAELAVSPNHKHPEAWTVAKEVYAELSRTVAEGVDGPLWLPVAKLMRAAEARQKAMEEATYITGIGYHDSTTVGTVDEMASNQVPMDMMIDAEDEIQPWSYWEAFIGDIAGADDPFWPLKPA